MQVGERVRMHRKEHGGWLTHPAQVTHTHGLAGIHTVAVIWDNPDGTRETRCGVPMRNTGEHEHWCEPLS
jgi:hypothetical protein